MSKAELRSRIIKIENIPESAAHSKSSEQSQYYAGNRNLIEIFQKCHYCSKRRFTELKRFFLKFEIKWQLGNGSKII